MALVNPLPCSQPLCNETSLSLNLDGLVICLGQQYVAEVILCKFWNLVLKKFCSFWFCSWNPEAIML